MEEGERENSSTQYLGSITRHNVKSETLGNVYG